MAVLQSIRGLLSRIQGCFLVVWLSAKAELDVPYLEDNNAQSIMFDSQLLGPLMVSGLNSVQDSLDRLNRVLNQWFEYKLRPQECCLLG